VRSLWWASLGVVIYTYAGYPLIMALLARFRPRPWKRAPLRAAVSIVMAVHNGAAMLPWKIGHLLTLEPDLISEIVLVSDGSTDGTVQLLSEIADPRARVIVLPQQAGKAAALNQGIAAATGEILLFVDIRPRIEPGAIAALLSNFADPKVGCAAGELLVQSNDSDAAPDAAASSVSGLYWKYEQWIRNCEAAWDSPVGVYGGFYAARRSLVKPMPNGLILDDMLQPLTIIRQGYRSVVDRSAIVVDQWPAKTADEFSRKVRTLAGNFQLLTNSPWLLSPRNPVLFQLVSHKLLRLAVPYFFLAMLIGACALATHSPLWAAIAALQLAFWLIALLALRVRIPGIHCVANPASALLVLNAAAVAGLYRALFTSGPLWKTWSPTAAPAGGSYPSESERERA
jgi:glycosyltransferase involved in cell wall biosynthesis